MPGTITITALIHAPVSKVWELWTSPGHITQWNTASPDWHTPRAESELWAGGKFLSRMEAKDGSMGFDFAGTFDEVEEEKLLAATLGDGRRLRVEFHPQDDATEVVEAFEPEGVNPEELQRAGWQAILDNFKRYAEGQ